MTGVSRLLHTEGVPNDNQYFAITLWTNGVPEEVTRYPNPDGSALSVNAVALNDDGIIAGQLLITDQENNEQHTSWVLWMKVKGQWRQKELFEGNYDVRMRLNHNLQIVGDSILIQNGHKVDLYDRIASGFTNLTAYDINEKGYIVGQADTPNGPNRAVFLLPVDIAVDANKDGIIKFAGNFNDPELVEHNIDQTSEDAPYRFWLNDDDDTEVQLDDEGELVGPKEADEIPPQHLDHSLHKIVSKRNLEDFSRLWIFIGALHDGIVQGDIQIGLRWRNVTPGTHPAINIYPSEDSEGSDNYLRDEGAALRQIEDDVFNNAVRDKFDPNRQTVDTSGVFVLQKEYWKGIDSKNPKKCLLFEGVSEGKGELQLVFFDRNGAEIGSGGSLWLELKNIKKMYVRAKGTPVEGVKPPWEPENPVPTSFSDDSNGFLFERAPEESNHVAIYVHGIHAPFYSGNNAYQANITTAETVFKRLWWAGYKGRFAFYKWPALNPAGFFLNGTGFEFNQSEYRAWKYGRGLVRFANAVPANYKRHIFAHSQGNAVVASAFQQYGLKASSWIITQGAIPISCFDSDLRHYVYDYNTPDLSSELGYRGYLNRDITARVTNFFNAQDTVTGFIWDVNHSLFKPTIELLGLTRIEYWYFSDPSAVVLRKYAGNILLSEREVNDVHESMAMAVKSRSRAIGQGVDVGGQVDTPVDLHATFDFGDEHGSQWESPIQESVFRYYQRLLEELE